MTLLLILLIIIIIIISTFVYFYIHNYTTKLKGGFSCGSDIIPYCNSDTLL